MSNVENLILEHLRAIRSDIGLLRDDSREIKSRLTSVEQGMSMLRHVYIFLALFYGLHPCIPPFRPA